MAGDEPLCEKALLSGYTVNGTFQQYAIGKAVHVARIPKGAPLDAIAPIYLPESRFVPNDRPLPLPN